MDPWLISPAEVALHRQHFQTLCPVQATGLIAGNHVKEFMMQSGLTPTILGQIWGLADFDGDGHMNLTEFSIACKLIAMKLKGYDIPRSVPASLILSLRSSQSALDAEAPIAMPGMMQQPMPPPLSADLKVSAAGVVPAASAASMMPGVPAFTQGMMTAQVPVVSMGAQPDIPVQDLHIGSTATYLDWNIPHLTRTKYGSIFNQTDKARTGYIAGVQAKNIFVNTGLSQIILSQIWTLADVDGDGKLSSEEFILSGYLCDLALKGEPLPTVLPQNLIPPSFRKRSATASSTTSDSVSIPGSVHGSVASGSGIMESPSTFEDKRRENFNKGQAELERRRQSLIEQQRREEEAKRKKEQEEAEARERKKKELERQKLVEWERQRKAELSALFQSEQNQLLQIKTQRDDFLQQLSACKTVHEMASQRVHETLAGISGMKFDIDNMRNSRDTKMKDMGELKGRLKELNQRLMDVTQERAQFEAKNKARAAKIASGEADDGCELSEFEQKKLEKEQEVAKLRADFKSLLERQAEAKKKNDALQLGLAEHRSHLEKVIQACKAMYTNFDDKRKEIRAEKAKRIRELTDPDHAWGSEEKVAEPIAPPESTSPAPSQAEAPAPTVNNHDDYVQYRALFHYTSDNANDLQFSVDDVIMVHPGQTTEPGWLGGELNGKVGWFPENYVEKISGDGAVVTEKYSNGDASKHAEELPPAAITYPVGRLLYEWYGWSKNKQLEVILKRTTDWWIGRVSDHISYIPASYVCMDSLEERRATPVEVPSLPNTEMPANDDVFVAAYPYSSVEPGDLSFEAGEVIIVTRKETEWWTGEIPGAADARSGIFPYNYVAPLVPDGVGGGVADSPKDKAETDSNTPEPSHVPVESLTNSEQPPAPVTEVVGKSEDTASAAGESTPSGKMSKSNSLKKSKKKKKDSDKKHELAKVVAPYEATSKEQMSLVKGQIIVVKKKTETGWWQGEIQGVKGQKRVTGWFPASYVKIMEAKGSEPKKFRAVFDFTGHNADELSFSAGEAITLIAKQETDWWKGECGGRTGVFPSNYVEPLE